MEDDLTTKDVISIINELHKEHINLVRDVKDAVNKLDGIREELNEAKNLYQKTWLYVSKSLAFKHTRLALTYVVILIIILFILGYKFLSSSSIKYTPNSTIVLTKPANNK